jgi:hypothetical protein
MRSASTPISARSLLDSFVDELAVLLMEGLALCLHH